MKKWTTLCPDRRQVPRRSRLELLTFYDFPKAMWKSLRHDQHAGESQSGISPTSFGTETAALIILHGLVAFGQIQLRKIDGHQQLPSLIAKEWKKVA